MNNLLSLSCPRFTRNGPLSGTAVHTIGMAAGSLRRFHDEGGAGAILIFLPGWGDIAKCHAALQDPAHGVHFKPA